MSGSPREVRRVLRAAVSHPLTQRTRASSARVVATCAVMRSRWRRHDVDRRSRPGAQGAGRDAGVAVHRAADAHRPAQRPPLERPVRARRPRHRRAHAAVAAVPHRQAHRVAMPWSTLFTRRVVFDSIEMNDWKMFVESLPDGRPAFPASAAAVRGRAQRLDDDAAVRAGAQRRVHLRGPRHAVERRDAQPRRHGRAANDQYRGPGALLRRHRRRSRTTSRSRST